MCNVFNVAKNICEAGSWNVTNLRLQKMLYIIQILYLGEKGVPLFKSNFEAWDYGPVAPEVYRQFKMFGDKPIEEWAFPKIENDCDKEQRAFIKLISDALTKFPSSKLVALTHRPHTGWAENYQPGVTGLIISLKDMEKEYQDVWLKKNAESR